MRITLQPKSTLVSLRQELKDDGGFYLGLGADVTIIQGLKIEKGAILA